MTDKPDAKTVLERLRELEEEASPAPWTAQVDEDHNQEGSVWCGAYEDERPAVCGSHDDEWPMDAGDAELIAALRNDAIPALAASEQTVATLQARVEALEKRRGLVPLWVGRRYHRELGHTRPFRECMHEVCQAALAAGEVKPADRVYDEWGQNVMDVPPEEVKHD